MLRYLEKKYISGDDLADNPTWDIEDSPWKAGKVLEVIRKNRLKPSSVCEVGCGAGAILAELDNALKGVKLYGYDISPGAAVFWEQYANKGISFEVGDFFENNTKYHDLILILDVIEHIADPWEFLEKLKTHGKTFLFHIPLDLSAQNVLRETPILEARRQVGHIHYFTKNLALELLEEAGFEIDYCSYSNLSMSGPRSSWKSKLIYLPRMLAYIMGKDFGVRLLGGESLLVLARPKLGQCQTSR